MTRAPTPARRRAVETYRARQEAKGLKRVTLFVPRDREDEIKQAAERMRREQEDEE